MVDVNWAGIARSARALGGEGTNILTVKTANTYDVDVLDAALPPDEGDSPANGGWFPGPRGWLLLVEGLDEQVNPWIEQLAARLSAAGVEGTLTGAGAAGTPMWAQRMREQRGLSGLVGFRSRAGLDYWSGWVCESATLDAAVDLATGWLTAHRGRVAALVGLRANFWVDRDTAGRILAGDVTRYGVAGASSYQQQRVEVRSVMVMGPAALTLSSVAEGYPWRETVDELRATLLAAPLDQASIAMVTHRGWSNLLAADIPGSDFYHRQAYNRHPERWNEFTLDPCGIQILTDRHLARANDLSAWRTTRLDEHHVLVEARDLEPWYATPRRTGDPLDADVIDQARRDFGDMILTPTIAEDLGLDTRPRRQN